jgi:hypothetical protein
MKNAKRREKEQGFHASDFRPEYLLIAVLIFAVSCAFRGHLFFRRSLRADFLDFLALAAETFLGSPRAGRRMAKPSSPLLTRVSMISGGRAGRLIRSVGAGTGLERGRWSFLDFAFL